MSEEKKKPEVLEKKLEESKEKPQTPVTELPPESPVRIDDGTVEEEKADKTSDDVYDEKQREAMLDEGSIDDYEEGFMQGYENPDLIQCHNCGQEVNLAKVIEWEVEGKKYWFCSKECLDVFLKKEE
jgi:hypothetical protein